MLISRFKKINFILSEVQWKVAKLKYGSWLHIYNTKNNHMAPECVQVARETYCNYVMMCLLRGSGILSCPFTCFAQEQLLVSSCCQFPTRRLKGEALSREVMLQSRTSKNKWIQWGNIKFIGQMSSRQLVLIYCC